MTSLPGAAPHRTRATRPGPWGTDRSTERAFGYPCPRPDPLFELQERLTFIERRLDALEQGAVAQRGRDEPRVVGIDGCRR